MHRRIGHFNVQRLARRLQANVDGWGGAAHRSQRRRRPRGARGGLQQHPARPSGQPPAAGGLTRPARPAPTSPDGQQARWRGCGGRVAGRSGGGRRGRRRRAVGRGGGGGGARASVTCFTPHTSRDSVPCAWPHVTRGGTRAARGGAVAALAAAPQKQGPRRTSLSASASVGEGVKFTCVSSMLHSRDADLQMSGLNCLHCAVRLVRIVYANSGGARGQVVLSCKRAVGTRRKC